jgi:DNA-binding response OmpR family regulator
MEAPTRNVPILIISAMDDARSKERALAAGATAYYTKPFSPTALLKEIESLRKNASGQHKIDVKKT